MKTETFHQVKQAVAKVVRRDVDHRVQVAVQLNRFNPHAKMYFPEKVNMHVSDPHNRAVIGDVVLISKLDVPRREVETHEIIDTIYHVGHIVDPLTGLRCDKDNYYPQKLSDEELHKTRMAMREREVGEEYSIEYNKNMTKYNKIRKYKNKDGSRIY